MFDPEDITTLAQKGELVYIQNTGDPSSLLGEHRSYIVSNTNKGLQSIYRPQIDEGIGQIKKLGIDLPPNFETFYFYNLLWRIKNSFKIGEGSPYKHIDSMINENETLKNLTKSFEETIRKDVMEKMLIFHRNEVQNYVAMPIPNNGTIIGFLKIAVPFGQPSVFEEELPFIRAIANLVVLALNRVEKYKMSVYYDSVTGLPKKILFLKYLDDFIKNDRIFSVIFTDLDHFKTYVDSFGHAKGNDAVNEYGMFLKSNLPEDCIVTNFAGDEFMVLVPNKNKNESYEYAEAFRSALENHFFPGEPIENSKITVSVGICDNADLDPAMSVTKRRDEIVQNADFAMFCAKKEGRNRVSLWTPETPQKGKGINVREILGAKEIESKDVKSLDDKRESLTEKEIRES